jgi:hypothetical protein
MRLYAFSWRSNATPFVQFERHPGDLDLVAGLESLIAQCANHPDSL